MSPFSVASPPFAPYYGTDIAYGNGKILALAGWYKTDFGEYTISTNSWRRLPDMAGYYATKIGPYAGASIEYDGSGSFYITRGGARTDLLTYTPGADYYPSSGTWTSAVQDLAYVVSWTSLTDSTTTPDDSSVSYQTRTSSDNISWTVWENVTGGAIASTAQRYIQVKATLNASTDLDDAPTLHSMTINYSDDSSPPSNPVSFTGSSQEMGG
jgi:hypothetical protein